MELDDMQCCSEGMIVQVLFACESIKTWKLPSVYMNTLIQFMWIVPDVILNEAYRIFYFVLTWILQFKFHTPHTGKCSICNSDIGNNSWRFKLCHVQTKLVEIVWIHVNGIKIVALIDSSLSKLLIVPWMCYGDLILSSDVGHN